MKNRAFCWKCHTEFSYKSVKYFEEPKCPICKTNKKVTSRGGNPHKDKLFNPNTKCKGKWWLKSARRIHAEATELIYQCSGCGEKDYDVFD